MSFTTELQSCINRHSKENGSNTPDLILAEYLASILASFDEIMRRRDKWYAKENKSNDSFQEFTKDFDKVPLGLYEIFWNGGGSSLAAIGNLHDGVRWVAPTNWTGEKTVIGRMDEQAESIKKLVLLRKYPLEAYTPKPQADNKDLQLMEWDGEKYLLSKGATMVGRPAFLMNKKGGCSKMWVAELNSTSHYMCDPIGIVASSNKLLHLPSIQEYASQTENKPEGNFFAFKDGKLSVPKEYAHIFENDPMNADYKPKPDWEILALREESGNIYEKPVYPPPYWNSIIEHIKNRSTLKTIHSVKRLSDGEVFSVDEVTDGGNKIKAFELIGDRLQVLMETPSNPAQGWLTNIQSLVKKQPQKEERGGLTEREFLKETYKQVVKEEPQIGHADWFEKLPRNSKSQEQRIEVGEMRYNGTWNSGTFNNYSFYLSKKISEDKFPLIKQAIEQVLNDEPQAFRPVWKVDRSPIDEELKWPKPTEEAKEMYRDYANKQKLFTTEDGVDVYEWFDDVFIVYADFSCDFNCFAGEVSPSVKAKDSRHKIFHSIEAAKKYIAENKPQPQKAERHWMGSPSPFDKAIWSSGRTEKDALFVTEDRIVINTGDTFWAVGIEFKKHRFDGASNDHHPVNWPMYHYFGKEDAADRYIKENKPLDISMKEIASCVTVVIKQGIRLPHNEAAFIDFKKLEEIIKSKQ